MKAWAARFCACQPPDAQTTLPAVMSWTTYNAFTGRCKANGLLPTTLGLICLGLATGQLNGIFGVMELEAAAGRPMLSAH